MAAGCVTVRGSFIDMRQDVAEAQAFAAGAVKKKQIELQPLSAADDVPDRLDRSDTASRIVLDLATTWPCCPAPTIMGESR